MKHRVRMLPGVRSVLLAVGIAEFAMAGWSQQQPPAKPTLVETGAPNLTANFSHFTNDAGRMAVVLSVTNLGSGVGVISEQFKDMAYGGNNRSLTGFLESQTNASVKVLPPGAHAQVSVYPVVRTNLWNPAEGYKIKLLVPYSSATNVPGGFKRFRVLCTDIPPFEEKKGK